MTSNNAMQKRVFTAMTSNNAPKTSVFTAMTSNNAVKTDFGVVWAVGYGEKKQISRCPYWRERAALTLPSSMSVVLLPKTSNTRLMPLPKLILCSD
jgi:hypothetical protein